MARILVVDDEELVRLTLRDILERAGHIVAETAGAHDVPSLLASFKPQLLLSDIVMPAKEGIEMIRELRGSGSAVRILAMSGGGRFGPDEILRFARKLGADDTIAKPFTAVELLDKVAQCLGLGDSKSVRL